MRDRRDWRRHPPTCPQCGVAAELVFGAVVYPHRPDLADRRFWRCDSCRAHVGVHRDSRVAAPLGVLATASHRRAKMRAHAAFDPLWRDGALTRGEAYRLLTERLGKSRQVHIGWASEAECEHIVRVAVALRQELRLTAPEDDEGSSGDAPATDASA